MGNVRSWHLADIVPDDRPRYGVSGGGGSNPLVPTKNTLKTSLLWLVFLCISHAWGETGELLGNNGIKLATIFHLTCNKSLYLVVYRGDNISLFICHCC